MTSTHMTMIQELEGTAGETMRRLAAETLDPRDETLFCDYQWKPEGGPAWELRGRFMDSGYRFHLRHPGEYAGVRELAEAIAANQRSSRYRDAWRAQVPHLEAW